MWSSSDSIVQGDKVRSVEQTRAKTSEDTNAMLKQEGLGDLLRPGGVNAITNKYFPELKPSTAEPFLDSRIL